MPMPVPVTDVREYQEARKRYGAGNKEQRTEGAKDNMRPIHDVGANDGGGRFAHMLPGAFEQSRFSRLRVGVYGDAGDGQAFVARLDYGFHAVAKHSDGVQFYQRFARVGSKATSCIREVGAGGQVDNAAAKALQPFFERRKMFNLVRLPIGDNDVRSAIDNRLHQISNAFLGILVVPVGIYDDIRAQLQRPLHPVAKRDAEASVAAVAHDVLDTELARDGDGFVG